VRIRLLFAAVCIFVLTFVLSPFSSDKLTGTTPFATVALAGHTLTGEWCGCGSPSCICGPGELGQSNKPVSDQIGKPSYQSAFPTRGHSRSSFDFGSAALILALSLFLWSRLRA
jgi:hypothetical protein